MKNNLLSPSVCTCPNIKLYLDFKQFRYQLCNEASVLISLFIFNDRWHRLNLN